MSSKFAEKLTQRKKDQLKELSLSSNQTVKQSDAPPTINSNHTKRRSNIKQGNQKVPKVVKEEEIGDSSGSNGDSESPKENSRVFKRFKHQKAKSISGPSGFVSRARVKILNRGFMGDAANNCGDEEPRVPTSIQINNHEIKKNEVNTISNQNESQMEECKVKKRCLCGCTKPKTDSNLSALAIRKGKDSYDQSSMSKKEDEEYENKLILRPLDHSGQNSLTLPEAKMEKKIKTIVSRSTRASSCGRNTDISSFTIKESVKSNYFKLISRKVRETVSLDISTPKTRATSVQNRKNVVNKFSGNRPSIADNTENNFEKVSRLLGPISNDFKSLKSYIKPNYTQKSNTSEHCSELGRIKNIRTPRLKQGSSLLDSNIFVRSLYKVKRDNSCSSLNVHSEDELNVIKREKISFNIPSLQNDLCGKEEAKDFEENELENKRRKDQPGHQISNINGSRRQKRKEDLSNLSFTHTDNFESLTKRNDSALDKFYKGWEKYKKNFERDTIKGSSSIYFEQTENSLMPRPRSKGISLEKNGKKSLFDEIVQTLGPNNYEINMPLRKKGFSFGRTKKFEISELPLVEDVNKMLDPVRRLSQGL